MSTKGPSNKYGSSKNSRRGKRARSIGYAWAKDFNRSKLNQHFEKHGVEMNSPTKESYVAHAVSFCNYVDRKNCISFIDKKGSTYKYNKVTNTLAIVTKDGYVITYFKPKDGIKYYNKEKGSKKR